MDDTRLMAYCLVSAIGGYIVYRVFHPFSNGMSIYLFTVLFFLVLLGFQEYRETTIDNN